MIRYSARSHRLGTYRSIEDTSYFFLQRPAGFCVRSVKMSFQGGTVADTLNKSLPNRPRLRARTRQQSIRGPFGFLSESFTERWHLLSKVWVARYHRHRPGVRLKVLSTTKLSTDALQVCCNKNAADSHPPIHPPTSQSGAASSPNGPAAAAATAGLRRLGRIHDLHVHGRPVEGPLVELRDRVLGILFPLEHHHGAPVGATRAVELNLGAADTYIQ